MRVELRLFATLTRYRGDSASAEPFDVSLPDGASLGDLLQKLAIPSEEVHLVMIDGRIVHGRGVRLVGGSRIGLFPPVGGG